MLSLGYIFLAVLGLSFLVFIHELGHYLMAHRVGMRVETFSIGFGKPIFSWDWRGERWQICWILCGGFVKIAGMDDESNRDPYTISDGFFGRPPLDRIKVAVMGPLVNIVFALFCFSFLWADDGREKKFTQFTHKIGWVDPESELYAKGVRPGDELAGYNDYAFRGDRDHVYAPMVSGGPVKVRGSHVNYETGERTPFEFTVEPYQHPGTTEKGILTTGIINSANYIIYDRSAKGEENPLLEGSPLVGSGITYGDRIVWVDGEYIFSLSQLNQVLNDGRALLTIQRGSETFLSRVPRVKVQELRMDAEFRDELADWQFEAGLNTDKLRNLWMIPYNLTNHGDVQNRMEFLDPDVEKKAFGEQGIEKPLQPGDRIIAVDGTPVKFSFEVVKALQQNRVNLIVERNSKAFEKISWLDADQSFDTQVNLKDIGQIASTIGTNHAVTAAGDFHLLKPIIPTTLQEFKLPQEKLAEIAAQFAEQRREIEAIEDVEMRNQALQSLDFQERKLLVGLSNVQDRRVDYNPIPTDLFADAFMEIGRGLYGLFSGSMGYHQIKQFSGPIGIISIVQHQSMVDIKESIFWIGFISLNLGMLNLLPIPMLDGGTIVFNLIELATGRRIPPKVLEKIVIPFVFLLVGFFIFLTFNDIAKIFGNFWR